MATFDMVFYGSPAGDEIVTGYRAGQKYMLAVEEMAPDSTGAPVKLVNRLFASRRDAMVWLARGALHPELVYSRLKALDYRIKDHTWGA